MLMRRCRWISLALLSMAPLPAGCFTPTNPCDPAADPAVQGQGTRIAGVVVDQANHPLAGVPVTIASSSATQVSGLAGEFAFEGLPPADDYELVALPTAPKVGGRPHSGPLACLSTLDNVRVLVVVPPESPEVELVRATGESSLFVAFGAVGEDAPGDVASFFETADGPRDAWGVTAECVERADTAPLRYRLQVRAPFDEWRDAQLSAFPWIDPMKVGDGVATDARGPGDYSLLAVDDRCAAALCARFAYLEDTPDDHSRHSRRR